MLKASVLEWTTPKKNVEFFHVNHQSIGCAPRSTSIFPGLNCIIWHSSLKKTAVNKEMRVQKHTNESNCHVCTADKAALKHAYAHTHTHTFLLANIKSRVNEKRTPDEMLSRFDVIRNVMQSFEVEGKKSGRREINLPQLLKLVC